MKYLITLVFFIAVCNATEPEVVPNSAAVEEVDVTKFRPMKCRNGTLGPSDEQGGRIQQECGPKYGKEPGQLHPNCFYFCQSEILGLLNNEGLPTQAIYDKFVEQLFPEEFQTMGTKWFRDCFEKYGQYVDKTDPECKIGDQFNTCTWSIKPKLICTE